MANTSNTGEGLQPLPLTINFYEAEWIILSLIKDFVSYQRNLEQSPSLTKWEVREQEIDRGYKHYDGPISLLYRFTDDEQQTPALGFQPIEGDETGELYTLVYLDASLDQLWRSEMNRDREV